jgi:paraquat-inducible protein B
MAESAPEPPPKGESFPVADVRSSRAASASSSGQSLITRVWLLTGLCLIVAIVLVVWNQKPSGPGITIRFEQGHGLKPGNTLQHRGIEVGEVTTVQLDAASEGVVVTVELQPQAKSLARHGSEFWIVRPRVSLTRITGLDTVVGARYLSVQPGPENSDPKFDFDGLETPLTLIDSEAVDVSIQFSEGHGLSVGDQVRHRGIVVGEVTTVDLNKDLNGVTVLARLAASATRLARAGTQFWVERPAVNAAEVRGLDTLLGGRYIAVQPGAADGELQTEFEGVTNAPTGELPEGGLEIMLEATTRGGLKRGVPVLYRGLPIGRVFAVGLASDAASVDARAWIEAPYRHLVRTNTQFWMMSGIDVSVGLSGVQVSADSLSSIMLGGISLATPDAPGVPVSTGHRFTCATKAEDEWLEWRPRLALGVDSLPSGGMLPKPVRASLRWQTKVFGFRRDRQRSGWVLPLSDGRLFGPADLLSPVAEALDGKTTLEAAGQSLVVTADNTSVIGPLAVVTSTESFAEPDTRWPRERIKRSDEPIDCLVITSGIEPLSISAARFTASKVGWSVDPAVSLTADHHGACVVSRETGDVVGVVVIQDTAAIVVPSPG